MSLKIEVYQQDVYPVIKAFQSRKPNEFNHTDNTNRELERMNTVLGWQEKYVVIPPMPEKHKGLEIANPPDPAFIAYVSLVDSRFHRAQRSENIVKDTEHKTELHKEYHKNLEIEARAVAITKSIEKTQFTFDEIKKGLYEQIDFNVDKRYKARDEWKENQDRNVEVRQETQRESLEFHRWNYWHLRDYREKTDQLWKLKKELSLSTKRLEDMKAEGFEKMQQPSYRREMMAFYNPTEIALIFAAHQMAQNYMVGFNALSAIDLPKFASGESGIRTVILTSAVKSY